jgi:hypothetical protein
MHSEQPPLDVRKQVKKMGVDIINGDWTRIEDDEDGRWIGYGELKDIPVAVTVALVTGAAHIEILAGLHDHLMVRPGV